MEVTRTYRSRFTAAVIHQAYDEFRSRYSRLRNLMKVTTFEVRKGNDTVKLSSLKEFMAEAPNADGYRLWHLAEGRSFSVSCMFSSNTRVSVELGNKKDIDSVLEIFDANEVPEPPSKINEDTVIPTLKSELSKLKIYRSTRFNGSVIKEAYDRFLSGLPAQPRSERPYWTLRIGIGNEEWSYNNPDEFFAELPNAHSFEIRYRRGNGVFSLTYDSRNRTSVRIEMTERARIQHVFEVFDTNAASSVVKTEREPITVFIGHGRSKQWRDLKDHLQDMQKIKTEAYEIGPRAGLSVKEVLQEMLSSSSFAVLVLTGEDMDADGEMHARENVIHELGLFQGKLGFLRAVALLEEGVSEFSNITGITQIRFSKGNIKETYGELIATISREFGEKE